MFKVPVLIETKGVILVTPETQLLGIAGRQCKYRDEGAYLRVYVQVPAGWIGPFEIPPSMVKKQER